MYVSVQKLGAVLVWTLNRPDRLHALGPVIGAELLQLCLALETELIPFSTSITQNDPPYRCLLIRASPLCRADKQPIWIAGGDLKELAQLREPRDGRAYALVWARIASVLQGLPIPVIAAIQGSAIGGGAELALAADIRLATQASSLHFKQLEVGLATGYGTCQRLVSLVGLARATDLLLRCRKLSAEEAGHLGLINECVADDEALEGLIQRVTEDLSRLSAKGLMVQKQMLNGPFVERKSSWVEKELDLFESLWMADAHKKFIDRFTQGEPK